MTRKPSPAPNNLKSEIYNLQSPICPAARRTPWLAVCLAALVLVTAPLAAAPKVATAKTAQGVRLTVGGKLIAMFRVPNGNSSPERRAEIAADRLKELLADGLDADEIEVRPRGEAWGVYGRGGLLMIATPAEGEARDEDPETVARRWAVNLKSAVGDGRTAKTGRKKGAARTAAAKKPERVEVFAAASSELPLPVGEARVMAIEGAKPGAFTAASEDAETATVRVLDGRAGVEVRGVNAGKAKIVVTRGTDTVAFTAWVKKWAGRVTAAPEGQVTGTSAPPSFIRRAAEQFMLEGVTREPGTIVRVTGPPAGIRALSRGESTQVAFPISITGEGYLPVESKVTVRVANTRLPKAEAGVLLYSNDPESVREFGTLFEGAVKADMDAPTRLFYHHQNRMGRPFLFQLQLVNPSDAPALVQVIAGEAGPFIEPMQCGHRAGQKYLAAALEDQGCVLRIAPRSTRTINSVEVPHLQTVSGIYGLRVMEGEDLVAHVAASAEASVPEASDELLSAARSEPHTYPSPQKDLDYKYIVGDKWTFIPMGKDAIRGTNRARKLFGNYGVMYNIDLDVSNPTDEARTVKVYLAPGAGWARGVFVFEGKLVEAPQVAPGGEAELFSVKLAPREARKLSIQGIPTGGSSYPLSLVVHS